MLCQPGGLGRAGQEGDASDTAPACRQYGCPAEAALPCAAKWPNAAATSGGPDGPRQSTSCARRTGRLQPDLQGAFESGGRAAAHQLFVTQQGTTLA